MDKNMLYGTVVFLNIAIICILMNKSTNAFDETPNTVDWNQSQSLNIESNIKTEPKPEIKSEVKPEIKEQLESKPAPSPTLPETQPKSNREKRILRRQGCPGCPNCQPNRTICY